MAERNDPPTLLELLDTIFYLAATAVIVYGLMSYGSEAPDSYTTTSLSSCYAYPKH